MAPDKLKGSAPRALALDALRGLAIMGMCLSGREPMGDLSLPAWMYHGQNPPPTGALNTSLAAFTWVDLVFPAFLFSMGVAFPFALSSRLAKGVPLRRIIGGIFARTLLLGFFAIYFEHVIPYGIDVTATAEQMRSMIGFAPAFVAQPFVLALIGFLLAFPVYTRLPDKWGGRVNWGIRGGGVLLMLLFLSMLRYKGSSTGQVFPLLGDSALGGFLNRLLAGGRTFSVYRSDIILVVLANMVWAGSLVWLATRNNIAGRLILGIGIGLLGHRVNYYIPSSFLSWTPIPWLYKFLYLKYLLIVVPGTIIGDLLYKWMKSPAEEHVAGRWTNQNLLTISVVLAAAVIVAHAGLQARYVYTSFAVIAVLVAAMRPIIKAPANPTERLLQRFVFWGTLWIIAGYLLEPFEGGIKKSPSTIAYYPMSLGLSIFLLTSLTVWIDLFGKRRWFGLLIKSGQNPMLAYMAINNLMEPIFHIAPIAKLGDKLQTSPWVAESWAVFKTFILAVLTSTFTRLKVYWRT